MRFIDRLAHAVLGGGIDQMSTGRHDGKPRMFAPWPWACWVPHLVTGKTRAVEPGSSRRDLWEPSEGGIPAGEPTNLRQRRPGNTLWLPAAAVFLDATGEALAGKLRPGNTGSNTAADRRGP
jgi:hypothetical protein